MIRKAMNNDYNILSKFYREFDDNGVDLFETDPFSRVLVYEKDKDIIGFISYSIAYDRAEINYIYVSDNHRKRGIASALMEFCIGESIKSGCVNITLEVSCENEVGIKLYEKFGFTQAAVRPRYYHGVDGLLMIRELIK
jgi:ribosomal-protein-alanine N-acetyltransferase